MMYGRTINYVLIAVLIIILASCGGGKKAAPALNPVPDVSGSQGGQTGDQPEGTTVLNMFEGLPSTTVDEEHVLVRTGDTAEEFQRVADKFGYTVEGKFGNWLKVRVPDGDIETAVVELNKEYTVFETTPLTYYEMPRENIPQANVKTSSFAPNDVFWADLFMQPTFEVDDENNPTWDHCLGQQMYMGMMGFEGAWDIALRTGVSDTDVTLAIIDAGVYDEDGEGGVHPDFNELRLHPSSARVYDDGTPPDPSDIYFETDGTGTAYRTMGHILLGTVGANMAVLNYQANVNYNAQVGDPPVEVSWVAGLAGAMPNGEIMVIKTGDVNGTGDGWEFSDLGIANSIDYAVQEGANIILLGMWSEGPVPAVIQTAVDNARNNDVLVIAPAGEGTFNDDDPENPFWEGVTSVDNITPASANGVISVSGTGFMRFDPEDTDLNTGFFPGGYGGLFGDEWNEVAQFSNTGGDLCASGWGIGFMWNFYNGYSSLSTIYFGMNLGTHYSAAYVASEAAMVYQALVNANGGAPPADVDGEIETILSSTGIGITGGTIINAGYAVAVANNGGYDQIIEGVDISSYDMSGAVFNAFGNAFLEVGQETQLAVNMTSSGGGYEIVVIWGDGTTYPEDFATSGDYAPYTPGSALPHTYAVADDYRCTIFAHETTNDTYDEVSFAVFVFNPLNVNLQIENADGGIGTQLLVDEVYRMKSNASYDVITGNVVTFDWDFNWDGDSANFTADVSDTENPLFSYGSGHNPPVHDLNFGPNEDPGYTIGLRVTQTRRPTVYFTIEGVTVE